MDGGQRAVLFQKFSFSGSSGVQQVRQLSHFFSVLHLLTCCKGVVGEGTHFLVPWFQQAIM